jgi:hypothetical protein
MRVCVCSEVGVSLVLPHHHSGLLLLVGGGLHVLAETCKKLESCYWVDGGGLTPVSSQSSFDQLPLP